MSNNYTASFNRIIFIVIRSYIKFPCFQNNSLFEELQLTKRTKKCPSLQEIVDLCSSFQNGVRNFPHSIQFSLTLNLVASSHLHDTSGMEKSSQN